MKVVNSAVWDVDRRVGAKLGRVYIFVELTLMLMQNLEVVMVK